MNFWKNILFCSFSRLSVCEMHAQSGLNLQFFNSLQLFLQKTPKNICFSCWKLFSTVGIWFATVILVKNLVIWSRNDYSIFFMSEKVVEEHWNINIRKTALLEYSEIHKFSNYLVKIYFSWKPYAFGQSICWIEFLLRFQIKDKKMGVPFEISKMVPISGITRSAVCMKIF